MFKLIIILTMAMLAGCGGDAASEARRSINGLPEMNPPSAPNTRGKTPAELDESISYFSESGHRIRIVKQFEYQWLSSHFRGLAFHYGTKLETNELTGDGRGCVILQPRRMSEMGPILVQNIASISPLTRDAIGNEINDDMRFAGIKLNFSVVGNAILYCFRHESLGPVTLQDFRDHLAGYMDFSE